jgi:hypothetical protein
MYILRVTIHFPIKVLLTMSDELGIPADWIRLPDLFRRNSGEESSRKVPEALKSRRVNMHESA